MRAGNLKAARRPLSLALAVLAAAALAAPPAAKAVRRWRAERFRAELKAAFEAVARGEEIVAMPEPPEEERGEEDVERDDDAQLRRLAALAYEGVRGPAFQAELLRLAAEEARKDPASLGRPAAGLLADAEAEARALREASARKGAPLTDEEAAGVRRDALLRRPDEAIRLPGAGAAATIAGQSWVNLGPAGQRFSYNGGSYTSLDSGRPNTVLVDPRAGGTVYLATSGGGVWKTYEYGAAATPRWIPITEGVGNLAIGALDLAKTAPDTLWAGLGDFVDTKGGQLVRSTDGGGTWSAPLELAGTPAGASAAVRATTVRDLKIAPDDANLVLVATDVGLFRSTNAAAASPAFAFVDLPNGAAQLQEAPWSIAWAGAKTWVVTGVQACAAGSPPPGPGGGQPVDASKCPAGNLGDLWRSTDDGATWSSARAAGAFAAIEGQIPPVGRMTLAAAPNAAAPGSATLYVFAANADEANTQTSGFLKSVNGGAAWTVAAKSTVKPANTTVAGDCGDLDVAYQQGWYNQAIAVDPGDPNKVLVGGMLCSARSGDGGATWQVTSHWLPFGGINGTTTSGGRLPYVHADWHAATIARIGGQVVAFAGTDGGLFVSTNLFSASNSTGVTWTSLNQGIVTHLAYSIGSGDPAFGNQYVAFTGLQDNGTRFRDTQGGAGTPTSPTTFNQVNGGDGFGVAVGANASGQNVIYWASVYGNTPRLYCKPTAAADCNAGGAFTGSSPSMPSGDSNPFRIQYSEVRGDPNSAVLSASNFNLWRSNFAGSWSRLTPANLAGGIRGVVASPFTYTVGGAATRLYGAPLAGGLFTVGVDKAGTLTWAPSSNPLGKGTGANAAAFLRGTSAMAFPAKATSLGGTQEGQAYLAASVSPVLDDNLTPVPAQMGHLFKTTNNGATWTAFHGNGTGFDLPNVPVWVLRFDPGDPGDQTVYAGTDLGLYRTTDGGATWRRFGVGLPMVRVTDIFISKNGDLMRVSTFGRGLWELYPSAAAPKGFAGNGDWDLNLQIDFLDLAALASRLGTSPATTSTPYYDWHTDLSGATSAIDEADLTALLAKFGDRP